MSASASTSVSASRRNNVPQNRLSKNQTDKLKIKLNTIKAKHLNKSKFSRMINDIGNILNINIIYLSFDELQINIIANIDIFGETLRTPTLVKSAFRSIKKSIRKSLRRNTSTTCDEKTVISDINNANNITQEQEQELVNEFNNFINNDNCLELQTILESLSTQTNTKLSNDKYNYTLCILHNPSHSDRKLKKFDDSTILYIKNLFTQNIKDEEDKKKIEDIIEFYLKIEDDLLKELESIKIPTEDSEWFRNITEKLNALKKSIQDNDNNFIKEMEKRSKKLKEGMNLDNLNLLESKTKTTKSMLNVLNEDYELLNSSNSSNTNITPKNSSRKTKTSNSRNTQTSNSKKLTLSNYRKNIEKRISLTNDKDKLRKDILFLLKQKMIIGITLERKRQIEHLIMRKRRELEELEK
jgi:hypothetical protein